MDKFSDLDAVNITIKIMRVFKHSSLNSVLCSVNCYSVLCSVNCYSDETKYLKIRTPGKRDFADL
jgi:hypothetical protein